MSQLSEHIRRRLSGPANIILTLGTMVLLSLAAIVAIIKYGSPLWFIAYILALGYQGTRLIVFIKSRPP